MGFKRWDYGLPAQIVEVFAEVVYIRVVQKLVFTVESGT
jgi:hypothetical protein